MTTFEPIELANNVPHEGAPVQRVVRGRSLDEQDRDGIWQLASGSNRFGGFWRWSDADDCWIAGSPAPPFWQRLTVLPVGYAPSACPDADERFIEIVRLGTPAWVFGPQGDYIQLPNGVLF